MLIMTLFVRLAQPQFSLWRHSQCDVIHSLRPPLRTVLDS